MQLSSQFSMRQLSTAEAGFDSALAQLLDLDQASEQAIAQQVAHIINTIALEGDQALLAYTRRWDQWQPATAAELEIPLERAQQAFDTLEPALQQALIQAHQRLVAYHRHQGFAEFEHSDNTGCYRQRVHPLAAVAVYVPGGRAAYPSSVLMNVVPAKLAGVPQVLMLTPTPHGEINPLVLAAAHIAGVDSLWAIGGAQALAAVALGTTSVPPVVKITGPGNAWVSEAKRQLFGRVGIDMIAGPSEVLVLCDSSAKPEWVAKDLMAQAEHDPLAMSLALSPDRHLLEQVAQALAALLPQQPRRDIIEQSLRNRGALIQVADWAEALRLVDTIAPEHLELALDHALANTLWPHIHSAGAVFVGHHSVEAFGDYCAGPNHVLPTSLSARFASPLSVEDFQRRSSLLDISPQGARHLAPIAAALAFGEGLHAHAHSALARS